MFTVEQMKERLAIIFKACDTPQNTRDAINKILDNVTTCPILNDLIEIISANVENLKKLEAVITSDMKFNNMASDYINSSKPLIILHPTDNLMFRVYENTKLSSFINANSLKDVSPLDANIMFKSFIDDYNKDMVGEGKQKWEPADRAKKRLNSYIDMPVARVLTRYTDLKTKYTDDQIRNFAASIDEQRKPMELSWAETPQDFAIMYGSGPSSCMTKNGTNAANFKWLYDNNYSPASFYAYFPFTRGAYIIKGGKVLARCITFKYPGDGQEYYGRLYTDGKHDTHAKFVNTLELAGLKSLEKHADYTKHGIFKVPDGTIFEIPGIPYKKPGVFAMPWPYFDNLEYYGKGFFASFDIKTSKFTIRFETNAAKQKENDMLPINNQNGVLLSVDYCERECGYCHKVHKDKGYNWYTANDGSMFDTLECMLQAGYVRVKTAMAEGYQLPDEHIIPIAGLHRTVFFSTLKAAEREGFFPLLNKDGSIPEEGDMEVTNKYTWSKDIGSQMYVSPYPRSIKSIDKLVIDFNPPLRNVELVVEDGWKGDIAHP